jgi:hypothetical protein
MAAVQPPPLVLQQRPRVLMLVLSLLSSPLLLPLL